MARGNARKRRLKPSSPEVGGARSPYPFVAIVGRPNVGKSTLFNRLVGQRLAIEEPTAGTTRDRIAAVIELEDGRELELCDTGGIGGGGDSFDRDVDRQIALALEHADLVVFVVDSRAGLVPGEEEIARRLKRSGKPILLVSNKAETPQLEATSGEFYALGIPGEVLCVSAKEGTGRSALLEAIADHLTWPEEAEGEEPEGEEDAEDAADAVDAVDAVELPEGVDPSELIVAPEDEGEGAAAARAPAAPARVLRLAILGRRNVGKSTYVNRLFGSERVIVSGVPGTTRDAIDVRVQVGGQEVILIDTAGLRKRGKADDHIEVISQGRAERALRRADAALLFLDCLEDIGNVDKRIAGMIDREHKACVIVANKWDLVQERMTPEQYSDYVVKTIPTLSYSPLVAISAKEGLHDTAPVELALELYRQSMIKVSTGPLNRALAAAIARRRPKAVRGKLGKVFFGTQVATNPVTVLLFVNEPELFPRAWRRYLAGQLRQHLPWKEIPVKLVFRARHSLLKRGGEMARRARTLGVLAEQVRWLDDAPEANVRSAEAALDGEAVQEALLEAIEATADDDPDEQGPE